MVAGFLVWAYCLPLPSMAQAHLIPDAFVTQGLFGISWLRPYALLGLDGLDPITHATFWSLLVNAWLYAIVSVNTQPSLLDLTQADLFVNIHKYIDGQDAEVFKREAKMGDLRLLLNRYLSEARTAAIFEEYEATTGSSVHHLKVAHADLINFAETHLAGAIGAASARLVMNSVVKEEAISLDEIMRILDQTREAVEHSRVMEAKNAELNALAVQLTAANEQLKNLDRLKADFITTVTHELRTPVTSIRSLSKIILDYSDELSAEQRNEYLGILVSESERISRLINQVLDLEKIQSESAPMRHETVDVAQLLRHTTAGMAQLFAERGIQLLLKIPDHLPCSVRGDRDRLTQVLVNLLSNAQKFCPAQDGVVEATLTRDNQALVIRVRDNGPGISPAAQAMIFEKFTQVHSPETGKPNGTGLGLFITKNIVEQHGGSIRVESQEGAGACFEVRLPCVTGPGEKNH
jgi:signal transduction histidine kinase